MKHAIFAAFLLLSTPANAVTITHDPGGEVINYAINAKRLKSVRFDGMCASACTLYLAIENKCITPRAKFGFHRAYGADPRANQVATRFLMKNYPAWVRRWIASKGGLSSKLIVMPNSYARKHIRAC